MLRTSEVVVRTSEVVVRTPGMVVPLTQLSVPEVVICTSDMVVRTSDMVVRTSEVVVGDSDLRHHVGAAGEPCVLQLAVETERVLVLLQLERCLRQEEVPHPVLRQRQPRQL